MGINDYTTLIELKTPNTKIFTETKSSTGRANTWTFTSYFIDGVSQCLAQKSDWDKSCRSKVLIDNQKNIINQDKCRTIDPKTVFIIGNKNKEFPENSVNLDDITKRDTFERFRRNNKNIEIITYDELYERANYIAKGKDELLVY
jgi:hypothetical protein